MKRKFEKPGPTVNSAANPRKPRSKRKPSRPSTPPRTQAEPQVADAPMRIAKRMARAGVCSRREAERWIEEGRVSVNGQRLKTPAVQVAPGDKIVVDGMPLPDTEPARLWRYHKTRGLVTTNRDPQGRPTVFANLPSTLPRVVSVGRLDFNTEGLLLLTNDGELARHLELPSTGWTRRYRVRAYGKITQDQLDTLKDGITVEGVKYGPIEASLDSVQPSNCWLTLGLREGKNREVRKVLGALGLTVNRLIRVSYGPFQLLDLKPGTVEPVKRRVLVDQLGGKLALDFGLEESDDENVSVPKGRPKTRPTAKSHGNREFQFEAKVQPQSKASKPPSKSRSKLRIKSAAESSAQSPAKRPAKPPAKAKRASRTRTAAKSNTPRADKNRNRRSFKPRRG